MQRDASSMRLEGPCEAAVAAMSLTSRPLPAEHLDHISQCPACKALAERLEMVAADGASPILATANECPDTATWLNVAAGLELDENSCQRLLEHAAACDPCGAALAAAVADLDLTNESQVVPEQPPVRSIGAGVASTTAMPVKSTRPRYGLYAAIAAGLLVGAVLWLRPGRATPEKLIASAYTQHRSIVARIPEAEYSPPAAVERSSSDQANIDLLRAETAILESLERDPRNATAIALRSRVDLLRRRYDLAIARLQQLREDLKVSSKADRLDLELGTAYLVRATSGHAVKPGTDAKDALQLLQRAVQKTPNDPVALFNRALAAEAAQAPREAEEAWTAFLRMEPKGGWAQEAERHLAELKKNESP